MSDQKFKIPRASDSIVIDIFKSICLKYNIQTASMRLIGLINLPKTNLLDDNNDIIAQLAANNLCIIENLWISLNGNFSVTYWRGGGVSQDQKSPIFDEITIQENDANDKKLSEADKVWVISELSRRFLPFDSYNKTGDIIQPDQRALLAIHNDTLKRLESLNEDLIKRGIEYRHQIDLEFAKQKTDNNNDYLRSIEALENDYAEKEEILKSRERDADEKLRLVDDRNNTHVRREIREKILTDVTSRIENFDVSHATSKKRKPVFWGMVVLGIALMCLLIQTWFELHQNNTALQLIQYYLLLARFTLLSAALIGTLIYYIKWENGWAQLHADSEFHLRQFHIDMNRANWVIETCLEWRKETESIFPKSLISSISANLFEKPGANHNEIIHPADELASAILGSASKVRLKAGDNEIELDKPGKTLKNKTIHSNAESTND